MTAWVVRVAGERIAFRVERRPLAVCAALLGIALLAVAGELAYGELTLSLGEVGAALVNGGEQADRFVVLELRLPRAAVGALAGAALALSGVIFQTFARNSLASPDIIGITGGAALCGVLAFVLGTGAALAPVAAFAGALGAAGLMYALAWRSGLSAGRLVLVGVGLGALAQAGIAYVLIQGRVEDAQQAYAWLVGSVNLRTWGDLWPLLAGLAILAPLTAALAPALDALALGDESARTLGVRVERARLALVVVGAGLAAIAVAAIGPVGFVAFVAPLIARRLTGATGAAVLPAAALCGAALVPAADLIARVAFAPRELPVGIVTSVLGAPVFLYLLRRANRRAL